MGHQRTLSMSGGSGSDLPALLQPKQEQRSPIQGRQGGAKAGVQSLKVTLEESISTPQSPIVGDLMAGPNCPVSKAFSWCGWRTLTVDWLFGAEHDFWKIACQENIASQLSFFQSCEACPASLTVRRTYGAHSSFKLNKIQRPSRCQEEQRRTYSTSAVEAVAVANQSPIYVTPFLEPQAWLAANEEHRSCQTSKVLDSYPPPLVSSPLPLTTAQRDSTARSKLSLYLGPTA